MNKDTVPGWFYIVAVIALLWNAMGVFQFAHSLLLSLNDFSKLTLEEQTLLQSLPIWAFVAFGVATLGGSIGSILLLMKSQWAVPVFVISFVGIIVQMSNALIQMKALEFFGPGQLIMPAMIVIFALILIAISLKAKKKGWIG